MSDLQIWVVIAAGLILLSFIFYLFIKRGGKITTPYASVYIPDVVKTEGPLSEELSYLYNSTLPQIRAAFEQRFLKELKNKGIPSNWWLEMEDYKFFREAMGNIVYSGNGINSIKTILEKEVCQHKEVNDRYIQNVLSRLSECARKYLNVQYEDHVYVAPGEMRERIISSIEVFTFCQELFESVIKEHVIYLFAEKERIQTER